MKRINLVVKDGFKLNEDPFLLNNMIRELGEWGGCKKQVGYVTACPCEDYIRQDLCTRKLFVRVEEKEEKQDLSPTNNENIKDPKDTGDTDK